MAVSAIFVNNHGRVVPEIQAGWRRDSEPACRVCVVDPAPGQRRGKEHVKPVRMHISRESLVHRYGARVLVGAVL